MLVFPRLFSHLILKTALQESLGLFSIFIIDVGKDIKVMILMANKHMKKYLTSPIIREMQVKTTMRHHLTSIKMAIIKKTTGIPWWYSG